MKGDLIKGITTRLVLLSWCCFCEGSQHGKCNRAYDKVYCFKRNPPYIGAELFSTLVMTDRDSKASQYSGQDIDWDNWAGYTHGFVCRCLQKLQQLGQKNGKKYHHISVVNYGECWTSEDVIYDMTRLNVADTCVGDDFKTCQNNAETECFGTTDSQYVFHIRHDGESVEEKFKLLKSECTIETSTVCATPSILHVSSTAHP